MKELQIVTRVYDRKEGEYVQRVLCVEITDEEFEMFQNLKKSITERAKVVFPFREKGFGSGEVEDLGLGSPLGDTLTDYGGKRHYRMLIDNDFHVVDTETGQGIAGWAFI